MFKKLFKWIGIFLLSLIVILLLAGIYTGYQQSKYEKVAVPFINRIVPLLSEWKVEKIKPLFTEEALSNFTDEDLDKMFSWLSKLGELKSFAEPQFVNISSGTSVRRGASTIVTYSILAQYEKGEAHITLRLLDKDGAFEIYHFNINSKALLE